jgi:ribosome-associated translation inhibitor RaiA
MNVDIQTEHVTMRPEWRCMIDAWVGRCRSQHPTIAGLDVTLRHGAGGDAPEEVDVVATDRARTLRATSRAPVMSIALRDALDALEKQVLGAEAVGSHPRYET